MTTAAAKGNTIALAWNSAPVLGVQEKDLELNGAPIDITSDENSGWRTLLAVSGQDEVNITVSGVAKDNILKTDWFAGTRTRTASFTYPDGGVITGTFYLASFKEKAPYKDAMTFDATLNSSGPVTYTPGS